MNIKRIVKSYKESIIETGQDISIRLNTCLNSPDSIDYIHLDAIKHRLGCWKSSLAKNVGGDISDLIKCWEIVCEVKNDHANSFEYRYLEKLSKGNVEKMQIANLKLSDFLRDLPGLIDEHLTRAVHESGIKL
jgi:hypothetical protein